MRVKFNFWFYAAGLALILGSVANGLALEILYPQDGTYVTKSNYLIIEGGQDPFLDGISVEINNVKSDILDLTSTEYRSLFADMLHLEPIFDPGENRLIVEGYVNGERFSVADTTVYYHDTNGTPPVAYRKEVFHLEERERACVDCHNMRPSEAEVADPRPDYNPCASCHQRMLNKNHVHGPAGVFDCLYCHDANSQPNKYQAKQGDALLCKECHTDKLQGFEQKKFIHGPIAAGMCLVCHDSHASDQPAQLVLKVNDLCLSCHSSVAGRNHVASGTSGRTHPLEGPVNPMNEQKLFNCSSCHDPHGGNNQSYFAQGIVGRMQLCAACHKK